MDNLRFVLFVLFVYLSYELWQAWQVDYGPKPPTPVSSTPADVPTPAASASGQPIPGASAVPGDAIQQGQRIKVVTDLLNLEIDTQGGDIRLIDLSRYPVQKDKPETPVRLLTDQAAELFISQSGFLGEKSSAPNHHSLWKAAGNEYTLGEGQEELRVPLSWTNDQGITVTKTYVFKKGSYVIEMEQQVSNQSAANWKGQQYTQLQRKQPEKKAGSAFSASSADRAYIGAVLYTPESKYEKISFDDMKDKNLKRESQNGWIAMIQHYFMAAWIPTAGEDENFYTKNLGNELYVIGALSPPLEVAPGASQVFKTRMYAGPKLQRVLENIAPGLELTEDFGKLTFIAKPVFWVIEQFYKIFNNWGWAIVFATISIKLLFYKLSQSSYRSMANMRKLQPKLQLLKEQHGEDKQKFNMAMMDLYKKEKVNPLGGCLPILVQMPVFIALYWVLSEAVELRQAPFIFWLQDLSAKDPYFILPLIYGVSMFIQQHLNPQPQDPVQAQVMKWLPVMFSVFFAFFPSGLVLYWVVNNVLSILQQYVITKQIEKTA
ncbi:MAG: membrane protein insertase YidC [Methylococcaceae bacterium]|nr:membrane protein insertase YidC [Methylococcaceae bacterium]